MLKYLMAALGEGQDVAERDSLSSLRDEVELIIHDAVLQQSKYSRLIYNIV